MRQETTSGGEKQASGAGAKKGWRRVVSLAGPVAVGVAGLAAAAGVGYVQGEKAGAARAVAHEIFTREHAELRELQAGVARVKQTIEKIRREEARGSGLEAGAAEGIPQDGAAGIEGAPAPAPENYPQREGEAALQDAPANADRAASPPSSRQAIATQGPPDNPPGAVIPPAASGGPATLRGGER